MKRMETILAGVAGMAHAGSAGGDAGGSDRTSWKN